MPDNMGCYCEGLQYGIDSLSVTCCKPAVEKGDIFDGTLCILCRSREVCVVPTTAFKDVIQCFCIDVRCAFPCEVSLTGDYDSLDVPCGCNVMYINCCLDWGLNFGQTFFTPLGSLRKKKVNSESASADPAPAVAVATPAVAVAIPEK